MCVYEAGMSVCAQIHARIARFPQKLAFGFSGFFNFKVDFPFEETFNNQTGTTVGIAREFWRFLGGWFFENFLKKFARCPYLLFLKNPSKPMISGMTGSAWAVNFRGHIQNLTFISLSFWSGFFVITIRLNSVKSDRNFTAKFQWIVNGLLQKSENLT